MAINLDVYYDVTNVEIINPYTLRLTFDDETEQIIDFTSFLHGPVFEPLRDLAVFNQVQLNKETGTIEWPTGADFNSVVLHDWPQYKDKILAALHDHSAVPA